MAETNALAANFVRSLTPADAPAGKAVVVALHGDLGSGKTTFTQAAAAALGVTDVVNSPTFVIQKKYRLKKDSRKERTAGPKNISKENSKLGFKNLIHIDAYRLDSADELARLGWQDLIKDPGNIIFIEWPERVATLIPAEAKKIHFTFIDETSRGIEIEN